MIQHIVLFRFKDSATPGEIVTARDQLLAMKKAIPEIQAVAFGPNQGPSVKEYSHVLMITCADMGAVQRYLDHPVHRQTVDRYVAPIRENRLAADVEV
jgi:hypothetical protein